MSPTDRQAIMKSMNKSPNSNNGGSGRKKSLSLTRPQRHARHKSALAMPASGAGGSMTLPRQRRVVAGSAPPPLPPKPAYMLTSKFEWDETVEETVRVGSQKLLYL